MKTFIYFFVEHNLRNADPILLNKQLENESIIQTTYPCYCNKMKLLCFFGSLGWFKIIFPIFC